MSYLNEAFKALSALNEDTFTLSDDGIKKLSEFEQNDDLSDDISVIDTEAETEDELQDSYVGKVILDCSVCHSKLYKDKEEVTLDEEGLLANVGEECPYCYTSDGFKVIGEVSEFSDETETEEVKETDDDDVEELEESLNEGIFDKFKKKKDDSDDIPNGKFVRTIRYKDIPIYVRADGKFVTSAGVHNTEQEARRAADKLASDEATKRSDAARDYDRNQKRNRNQNTYNGKGKNNEPLYNPVTDHYYTESLEEDYSEKYIIKAKTNDGKVFYYDAELDNLTTEVERATQYADYDIANDDLAMILGSCENDFEFITLETVPQLDLLNKDDTVEEAVGTLERPMSTLDGTLGNVLTAHKDELSKVRGKEDGLAFLDSIEPEVKNKGYLRRIKEQIAKIPEYKVPMLLYNLILKGDGLGVEESLTEDVNNVQVDTDDATVSVSQDDNGTVTVQTTPKDDGTTPMSDETIVPVSDETQTEIENNTGDDEEIDIAIDEFDEESFDELGESYLKSIYENVDSYRTTNITNYNDQIKVEGVIKFDTGSERKTSFIFESKDCTKSGKLRFIGENVEITNGKKAFTITGSLNENKFITESFNYNYKTINEDGQSSRIYGTLRKERASK